MKVFWLKLALIGTLSSSLIFAQKQRSFNVATYNLRYNTPNDSLNAWPYRRDNVKALIRYHEFDIFGTQEGLRGQLDDLAQMSEYAFFGAGRDDGQQAGEHSAVFYRKDRFKVLQAGDFWLSETPDRPSKGWDAKCCNRICSWGKMKDLRTKKTFYFFSVHFDHQGVEARRQSGRLMLQKMQEIAQGMPIVCVGDFNSTPDTEQIRTLQTLLNDAHEVTQMPPYGPEGTFNAFRWNAPMKERIDYIFVDKRATVLKYAVLTDAKNQRFPSDHQPVVTKIEW
ncbi:MAG: endonuclease/exonuclease/phosphatase family protein [Spirosomaceae bacterium]|jgi:endonuclease/exonuclease/phosphatase family metal-dependent hydrolase|nr:endonuclease/exonuclease/phosphatase family protein [Spirosomataceae bacterium]